MGSASLGTIVIAEDDHDLRELLADGFRHAGYSVVTASNGAEAVEVLEAVENPVAVLLDLQMPGVLGSSVFDYVRNEPRLADARLAVVSGSPQLAPPGARVFTKPATLDELLQFVRDGR